MYNSNPAPLMNRNLHAYQKSQILSMEPVPLLIKVYDFIILNCKKQDADKASRGLVELMSALNFDHQEIALGLFRLYQFCQDKIKQGEFEDAIPILEGLRNSWVQSLKVEKELVEENAQA